MGSPIPSPFMPNATAAIPGKVSIGTQTFGGSKTFQDLVVAPSGISAGTGISLTLTGGTVDGSSAVGVIVNSPSYVVSGSKLFSLRNNSTEMAYFGKTGSLALGSFGSLKIYPRELVPAAPIASTPTSGGSVTAGTHSYKYTFVTPEGESVPSLTSFQVDTTTNKTVPLGGILPGSPRCTARKIYRTDAGDTGDYKLVHTLSDNTTITWVDTTADGSGAAAPTVNTTANVYLGSVVNSAATAVGHVFDTGVLTIVGTKIASFKNNLVEKASIGYDGTANVAGVTFPDTSTMTTAVPVGGTNSYVPIWDSGTGKWVPGPAPGGSAPANMVTTDTTQSISGDKTFSNLLAGTLTGNVQSTLASASSVTITGNQATASNVADVFINTAVAKTHGGVYFEVNNHGSPIFSLSNYGGYADFWLGGAGRFGAGLHMLWSGGVAQIAAQTGGGRMAFIGNLQNLDNAHADFEYTTYLFNQGAQRLVSFYDGGGYGGNATSAEIAAIEAGGGLRLGRNIGFTIRPPAVVLPSLFVIAATLAAGAGINDGTHSYKYSFVTAQGESILSVASNTITCGGGSNQATFNYIPLGGPNVTARNLYRTKAGGSTYYYIGQIANNTVYTYTDTAADSALTVVAPTVNNTSTVYTTATADDGTIAATGHVFDTGALTSAASKIASFRSNTVEKASISASGNLTLAGGIAGQKDIKTSLTATNGSTMTLVYSTGNAWVIDASALSSSDAFTVAISGAPSSSFVGALTLILLTGGTIPTITWAAGMTAPVIVPSSENWFTISTRDGGTTYRTFALGSF